MKKLAVVIVSFFLAIGMLSFLSTPASAAETNEDAITVSFVQEYAQPGQAFEAKVEGKDTAGCIVSWYVDGVRVGTGKSYTPAKADLEKMITVKVSDKTGKLVATKTVLCSKLPVLYIDTEGGAPVVTKEEYLDATLTIQGNAEYNSATSTLYSGATEIKGRGNSTWLRFPKKPYRLKLDKKTDLFGLGKNKHWALLANYIDDSLMRNSLAGNIAEQLGVLKMDSIPVELVLNGEHLGSYLLIEHVRADSKRVDIFDWEGVAGDAAEAIAAKHGFDGDTEDALAAYMEENMGWMTTKAVTSNGKTYKLNDYLAIYQHYVDEYYK